MLESFPSPDALSAVDVDRAVRLATQHARARIARFVAPFVEHAHGHQRFMKGFQRNRHMLLVGEQRAIVARHAIDIYWFEYAEFCQVAIKQRRQARGAWCKQVGVG